MNWAFDPLWFGILFVMNMEMAYITPPFGFNLFLLKSVVPKEVTMGDIYRSVGPFVLLQALALGLVMILARYSLVVALHHGGQITKTHRVIPQGMATV